MYIGNYEDRFPNNRLHQGSVLRPNISDANAAASRFDLSSCARCVCTISTAVGYQLGMCLTLSVLFDIMFTIC